MDAVRECYDPGVVIGRELEGFPETGPFVGRDAVMRQWERFRELTHPEIEWAPFEDNHTISYGLAGAMRIRNAWLDAWVEHRLEIEEMHDAGDDVVATVHLIGRGKGSGAEVEVRLYGHV